MNTLRIEFFHDVICSFCFPMSYRMRKLQAALPQIRIVHRSFALVHEESDFERMFGSRAAAKTEILQHWQHANHNDDLHRFNIEGMARQSFPFPCSMNSLIACKAAYLIAGDAGYWDLFDALQQALFVENRNIDTPEVIAACVEQAGFDIAAWQTHFVAQATRNAVEADFQLARQYRINSVPTLIVNGKYQLSGAMPLPDIQARLENIQREEGEGSASQENANPACRLDDGKTQCR